MATAIMESSRRMKCMAKEYTFITMVIIMRESTTKDKDMEKEQCFTKTETWNK